MKTKSLIPLVMILALTACGGGSDSSADSAPPSSGPTPTPAPTPAPAPAPGGFTNRATPYSGYDGVDSRETGWIGDLIATFTTPPFAGNPCPTGGGSACASQIYFNPIDPVTSALDYLPGYAAFDSKGLFRGYVGKVATTGQAQEMVYRDPDASGSAGVAGAGSDGPLRWGAWANGAYRTCSGLNTATIFALDSHYVVGRPWAASLGGAGSVTHAPIANAASQTLQLEGNGSGGPTALAANGTLTAFSATWDASAPSGTTLPGGSVELTVRMASGLTFSGTFAGNLGARTLADINFEVLPGASTGQATVFASVQLTPSDGTSCNRSPATVRRCCRRCAMPRSASA